MERLQGPINPFLGGEEMNLECLETGVANSSSAVEMSYLSLISSHHHRQTPFLQLLLRGAMGIEKAGEDEEEEQLHSQSLLPSYPSESQFQLLQLQSNRGKRNWTAEIDVFSAAADPVPVEQLESCISHASESQSDVGRLGHDHNEKEVEIIMAAAAAAAAAPRAKKKRKRARASAKKPEEVETQRLTHIAVERNRRRLMNDHLAALRSLIPPSFVQRGDQASIIGGAIDFVKELEQLLLSLQAQKRIRTSAASSFPCTGSDEAHGPTQEGAVLDGFFISPQYTTYSQQRRRLRRLQQEGEEEMAAVFGVDVEAKVVQGHVSLKVAGPRRAGRLARAIDAMEELRLSVLHLNIASLDESSVLYSLNLKMEEDCRLGSADEVAAAVHQIFTCINACC